MARLSFRCDEDLVRRVDAARGDVARERWLRRAVEQALGGRVFREQELRAWMGAADQDARPDDVPGPSPLSSRLAKRDVRPIPKGKP